MILHLPVAGDHSSEGFVDPGPLFFLLRVTLAPVETVPVEAVPIEAGSLHLSSGQVATLLVLGRSILAFCRVSPCSQELALPIVALLEWVW